MNNNINNCDTHMIELSKHKILLRLYYRERNILQYGCDGKISVVITTIVITTAVITNAVITTLLAVKIFIITFFLNERI